SRRAQDRIPRQTGHSRNLLHGDQKACTSKGNYPRLACPVQCGPRLRARATHHGSRLSTSFASLLRFSSLRLLASNSPSADSTSPFLQSTMATRMPVAEYCVTLTPALNVTLTALPPGES